jgi:hypothetical protein
VAAAGAHAHAGGGLTARARRRRAQVDSYTTGLVCFAFIAVVLFRERRAIPVALIVFIVGIIMAAVALAQAGKPYAVAPWWPPFNAAPFIKYADWGTATMNLSLPQLPLTALNSVVAVTALVVKLVRARGTLA